MSEKLRKFLVMAAGVLVISAATVISGCRANISGTESDRMVEYTVICGDAIPEEFKKQINESKAKAMKLTYKDDEYLYIAEGFGTKETGGYSITVNQFYVKDKAMYFDTKLLCRFLTSCYNKNSIIPGNGTKTFRKIHCVKCICCSLSHSRKSFYNNGVQSIVNTHYAF